MSEVVDVVIVGAGPYGLSIAAHLQALGMTFRIFGPPMDVWRNHMPKGMLLKSDGFASNLSDPAGDFTLKNFCKMHQIPYDDTRVPVALETFVDYALAFQKKLVPQLDTRQVTEIDRVGDLYSVQLEDGECINARRVVLAVGISHFSFVPSELASLPKDFLSHSSAHRDCTLFRGKKVTVIGGGASAVDLAALLHESGADVCLVARAAEIRYHDMPGPGPRTLWQRMRNPSSGLGPGWKSRFYTDAPWMFRHFPENVRLRVVKNHLGPAPGWPMKKRVQGKVPMLLGSSVKQAKVINGRVSLTLVSAKNVMQEHEADHVVAATGYKPDLDRLSFLGKTIRTHVRTLASAPVLSPDFQSSIPGLYFVGIAAANNFGPMMRFAYGSDYTARRISKHLQKQLQA